MTKFIDGLKSALDLEFLGFLLGMFVASALMMAGVAGILFFLSLIGGLKP